MIEIQRYNLVNTYRLLYKVSNSFEVDNISTWLLVTGLAETYEFVMQRPNEKV